MAVLSPALDPQLCVAGFPRFCRYRTIFKAGHYTRFPYRSALCIVIVTFQYFNGNNLFVEESFDRYRQRDNINHGFT